MRFLFWNIKQFNMSAASEDRQTRHRQRVNLIAATIRRVNADIIGFVELRSGESRPEFDQQYDDGGGTWALRELVSELGVPWRFITSGGNASRDRSKGEIYGFVYDSRAYFGPDRIELTDSGRDAQQIEFQNRVPGYARFVEYLSRNAYDIILLHAPKPSDRPEKTIELLHNVREIEFAQRMIIAGDFNTEDNTAFRFLGLQGFQFAVRGRSSYKTVQEGDSALSSAYDAILYKGLHFMHGGIYDYIADYTEGEATRQQLRTARGHYTDHAAAWAAFRYPRHQAPERLPRVAGFAPNVKRCVRCSAVHGRMVSVFRQWHRCTNPRCGAVFCHRCGKILGGKRLFDPTRACSVCGSRTTLISL